MSTLKALKDLEATGYLNPYGTWRVSTEGDVEGRSTRELGAHTGYIDEIALKLANQCYYSLRFEKANPLPEQPMRANVNVSLDIDSATWDLSPLERVEVMRVVFKDRPVHITEGQYYASFTINAGKDPQEAERARKAALIASAAEKVRNALTPEEYDALFKPSPKRSQ